ncbi:MAG: hypothetical protein VX642_07020 [Bdellovibrionota bacterium]|nr:hypothetical protein [Bdellovibrionota bacterium]
MTAHDTTINIYTSTHEKFSPKPKTINLITPMKNEELGFQGKIYGFMYSERFGFFGGFYEYEKDNHYLNFKFGKTYTPDLTKGSPRREKTFYAEYTKPLTNQEYYNQCGCPDGNCRCSLQFPYSLKLTVSCVGSKD